MPDLPTGRTAGILMLLHLAAGLMAPFILLRTLVAPRQFLESAAASPAQFRTAVFLLFVGSALAIGISCATLETFRRFSPPTAFWLLTLAAASFTLQAVDNAHLLSMLTLSQSFTGASPENRLALENLAPALTALRKWSHYSFLLVGVGWIALLCASLYRFRLVPRPLAAVTLLAAAGQIAGVTLPGLLGHPPETRLAMPLAPAYSALALWLIFKGLPSFPAASANPPQ